MEYRLEELFDLQMGKTPSRNNPEYWDSNDNKWISIADLSKCGKYIDNTKEYLSNKAIVESGISQIPANTVIMSFKLSIGKTAITSEPMYSNEAIMSFRDKQKVEILPDYFYYLLLAKDWDVGTNKAVMGKTLNKATLSKIKINIHDIEKQKEIVEVLDKISGIISMRQQELQKLDELVKARFVEMFGDPKYNENNLVKISDIGYLTSGGTPSRSSPEFFTGDIRWYSAGELNSLYLTDSIEHITFNAIEQSSAKLFDKGSLMIGMYDTAAFKMGILTEQSSSNQACANLKPTEDYNAIWLYYLFDIMKPIFLSERQGVRQKNLSLSKIRDFLVPSALLDQQNQFADFVNQVNKLKVATQKALDEAQLLFDSLMQEYFG